MLRPGLADAVSAEDRALAARLNNADLELYAFARTLFERRVAAAGPDFTARLRRFRFLNGKYQKMCATLEDTLVGERAGPILKPKG